MDGEDRIPVYVYEITAGYLFDPISVALLDFHWYIPTDKYPFSSDDPFRTPLRECLSTQCSRLLSRIYVTNLSRFVKNRNIIIDFFVDVGQTPEWNHLAMETEAN